MDISSNLHRKGPNSESWPVMAGPTSTPGSSESANKPTARTPQMAAAPWTPTAPTGSSTLNRSSLWAELRQCHQALQVTPLGSRVLLENLRVMDQVFTYSKNPPIDNISAYVF